ncbi:hypothetical protein ABPG74_009470 [Tetrahymena malaccensis]
MIAKQKKQRLEQIKKLENYQLSSLTCLKINLYENRSFLRDNELLDTCSILTQCPNITYLSLDFSKRDITLQQMKQLGPFISQCTQLLGLHLNFYSNRICSETAQILGSAVMRLQNLQKLKINLCCQYIQNEGMEGLIQSFSSDINTLSLKLYFFNNFTKFLKILNSIQIDLMKLTENIFLIKVQQCWVKGYQNATNQNNQDSI